jgi:hypothetical protein
VIVTISFFIACDNTWEGESTIFQFQDAINTNNFDSFKDTLSEDSLFWIGNPDPNITGFLNYFTGFTPVAFSNFAISENGNDATVTGNATYATIPYDVKFIMRKHSGTWKIREYWDDNNINNTLEFVWQKIGWGIPLE